MNLLRKILMIFRLLVIFIFLVGLMENKINASDEHKGTEYFLALGAVQNFNTFPFISPSIGNSVYVSSVWGLKINSISIDGRLASHSGEVRIDESGRDTCRIDGQQVVYFVYFGEGIDYAETVGKELDDYKVFSYTIPKKFKDIIVKYQVRFPDLTLGPECTVHVMRRSEIISNGGR